MRRHDRYGTKEVRRIVENYQALKAAQDTTNWGLRALVSCADIDRALEKAITWEQWEVVLLHGLLGAPMANVSKLLGIEEEDAWARYTLALEYIQWYLNGDMAAGWTQHVQQAFEEDA